MDSSTARLSSSKAQRRSRLGAGPVRGPPGPATSSPMQVRQVALVARDLEPVVDDLCAVLGLEVAFRDPGVAEFGLRNAVLPIGRRFLEVVSPVRADATA